MNGIMKTGFLAMFCLLGMTFAFGPMGMGANEDVPVEARAEFMQATHEGDYEGAMALHEEYGLGGKKMEHSTPELFELVANMFKAQTSGNWIDAVGFQDQIRELAKEHMGEMQEQRGACKAAMEENEDALELREQIHEAMHAGDRELAKELHEQMKELMPEECVGLAKPKGMRGQKMERSS